MKFFFLSTAIALAAIFLRNKQHNEDDLINVDYSHPPPLPIFIGANMLSDFFQTLANALKPPPIRMFDISMMFHTTMLAYVCQKFDIPDFLASGPKTVEEIAEFMQTKDTSRVERLMYALASEGMTTLDKKSPDPNHPRFVNTPLSATLRTDHPPSVKYMIAHQVQEALPAWTHLAELFGPDAKDSAWDLAFPEYSWENGGIWKFFEENKEREKTFAGAMTALEAFGGKAMALDGPFGRFKRVVDVGGSVGHFLYKILDNYPETTGVLFDRAPVIETAEKLWQGDGLYSAGTQGRVTLVKGSFFEGETLPELQDGDAVVMRYVLHDWGDEDVLKILRNIRSKIGDKQVTLLIGESAIPDRHVVGKPPVLYHIDMQMMTLFGDAADRTPAQWKAMLPQTGFEFVTIYPTRSMVHWIEVKPTSNA